jgi:hypothetical protein
MPPTWEQIQRAAYERWERREWAHGADGEDWAAAEMDLAHQLDYRPAAEYPLAADEPVVVGARPRPACRFCERSAPRAKFSRPRPIVPEAVAPTRLASAEVCDECHEQFVGSIDADFGRFWRVLAAEGGGAEAPASVPVGAYKAMVRMAVAVMPPRELQHFTDTIEWVGNPDHDFDGSLFSGTACLAYRTRHAYGAPWVALSRRIDPDAPLPYAIFAMAWGRTVVEVAPPLCAKDQDHDGVPLRPRGRSFTTGFGREMAAAERRVLPLEVVERPRRRMRLFA